MQVAESKWKLYVALMLFAGTTSAQYTSGVDLADPLQLALVKDSIESNASSDVTPTHVMIKKVRINEMPLFCKMEEKISQSARTQLRVRLGSTEYVDYLEGKRSTPR